MGKTAAQAARLALTLGMACRAHRVATMPWYGGVFLAEEIQCGRGSARSSWNSYETRDRVVKAIELVMQEWHIAIGKRMQEILAHGKVNYHNGRASLVWVICAIRHALH